MTLNLHAIVRSAIQAVNTDTPGTVYVSTGYTNSRGKLTPQFTPVTAQLQVQSEPQSPLDHSNNLQYNNAFLRVYAYGSFSDLSRPDNQGGDVVHIKTGVWAGWWYVSKVLEWWPGWCAFEIVQQLNAAQIGDLLGAIST